MSDLTQSESPRRIRILAWIQLPIAILAIGVSIYAGLLIKPLLQQRSKLQQEIQQLQDDIQANDERLRNLRVIIGLVGDGRTDSYNEDYAGALERFDKALQLDPNDVYVLNLKGYALHKLSRSNEAIVTLQRAASIDPDYVWTYVDLALTYCGAGNYDEAAINLTKALKLDPNVNEEFDEEFQDVCRPIILPAPVLPKTRTPRPSSIEKQHRKHVGRPTPLQ